MNGLRAIGKGQHACDVLCGILNLPNVPKISRYLDVLENAASKVCFGTMKRSVEEAVGLNDENRVIYNALDGTWQKRGVIWAQPPQNNACWTENFKIWFC